MVSSLVINTLATTFISLLSVVTVYHFHNFLEIQISGLWPLKMLVKAYELWKGVVFVCMCDSIPAIGENIQFKVACATVMHILYSFWKGYFLFRGRYWVLTEYIFIYSCWSIIPSPPSFTENINSNTRYWNIPCELVVNFHLS